MTVSGVWEGDFFSDSWHIECNTARREWQEKYPEACGEWPEQGDMQRGSIKHKDELEAQS
jgi:hypothetical protein